MPVYSHSRLSTFEQCQLKYKFKYIDEIQKPDTTVEAFMGSRVHEALQKLYDDLARGHCHTLEDLFAFYKAQWKKLWGPHVRVVKRNRNARDYFQDGVRCIRNFYNQHHPFDQSETLQTEARITFPLDADSRYQMLGFIDRVARSSDGAFEIHDYKTSNSLPTQRDVDSDRQLSLYQIGLPLRWKEASQIELIWHYLKHGKTLRSRRTPAQLTRICNSTIELIDRIERTATFPANKSILCDWCEYKPDCPEWK